MTDPTQQKSITRRDLAIAGLSFVVSGVGGAVLQRWLVRGKPVASISAIGFGGLDTQIALPKALVDLSARDSWGSDLKESASYDELRRRYATTLELLERLQATVKATETWISENGERSSGQISQVSSAALAAYPYLLDNVFGSALLGAIRRSEVLVAPVSSQINLPVLYPLTKNALEPIVVNVGRASIRFPVRQLSDDNARIVDNLAWSISRGVLPNLRHYGEQFLNASRRDLLTLQAVEQALREVLVQESRMSALLTLQNLGDTPLIFMQEYVLHITTPKYSRKLLLVSDGSAARIKGEAPALAAIVNPNLERDLSPATRKKVDDQLKLLPATPTAEHHVLAPNSIKVISLRSPDPIGKDAGQIFALYQNEFVECQIAARLIDGTPVHTPKEPFGKDIELKRRQAQVG